MPRISILDHHMFHPADENNLINALRGLNEGVMLMPRLRVRTFDGLKFFDIRVVMSLDGLTRLVHITILGLVLEMSVHAKHELPNLTFWEQEGFNLSHYFVPVQSLGDYGAGKIVAAIKEVLARRTHWCVVTQIHRDRYIMVQKAPESEESANPDPRYNRMQWNLCVRHLSGCEIRDVAFDNKFADAYLTFPEVQGCKFLNGLEFRHFEQLAYCNVAEDCWDPDSTPVWGEFNRHECNGIFEALRAMDASDEENKHLTVGTEEDAFKFKLIQNGGTVYMTQCRVDTDVWQERPIAQCMRTRKPVESTPVQARFQRLPAAAGSKRPREA